MRRTTTILILAASCAALAIAPSAATAKATKFRGLINQPLLPAHSGKARDAPEVDMKVQFTGKRPTSLYSFNYRGIYGPCAPGSYTCQDTGTNTEPGVPRDHPICFPFSPEVNRSIPIRNRRFSRTFRDEDYPGFLTVTGRVTKKSVTGTIHAYDSGSTCDSGVLAYTARKTNLPSGSGEPTKPLGR